VIHVRCEAGWIPKKLTKNALIATNFEALASSSIQFDAVAIENFTTLRSYLTSWYTPDVDIGVHAITANHQLCANVIALQKKLGLSAAKYLVASITQNLHLIANPDANQAIFDSSALKNQIWYLLG